MIFMRDKMAARGRPSSSLLDNDEMNQNHTDEEEEEEDARVRQPFSGVPSRERHITDMRFPRSMSVIRKKALAKRTTFIAFVVFLGFLVILFTVVAHTLSPVDEPDTCQNAGTYLFDPYANEGNFRLCHSKEAKLTGSLGRAVAGKVNTSVEREREGKFTYSRPSVTWTLSLTATAECVSVMWTGETSYDLPLMDCYDMSGSHWYGGYEAYNQLWPINEDNRRMQPFLSNDTYQFHDGFGSILHPVWLNSKGVLLFVDKDVPLHVSINSSGDGQLCLQSVPYALGCTPTASQNGHLAYSVCQFDDAVAALKYFLQKSHQVTKPRSIPEEEVFMKPIWSTWAYFKDNLNQELVCAFANEILASDIGISQLEIDDGYSESYGDFSFDYTKFPHGFTNISDLGSQNDFVVTAWVHPFVNYDSDMFKRIITDESNHLIPGGSKETTAIVKWWRGHGALINFELNDTTNWYRDQSETFVNDNGLASLKFDAGESEYLPDCLYFPDSTHPATYTQKYIEFAANFSWSSRAEVRVGYFTQEQPIFVRMMDRDSTWGTDNGLRSVVTTALTMSLMGYNFIIPDMIGGNNYKLNADRTPSLSSSAPCRTTNASCACANCVLDCPTTDLPDMELYIRWLQLSVFLPVMQFSIPPWVYGKDLVDYAKRLVTFHSFFAGEYIIQAANQTRSQMAPLIRPVWWLDPLSDTAHECNDEFLVGDSILVAPILNNGTKHRSVYLPPGTWTKCVYDDGNESCKDINCAVEKGGGYNCEITIAHEAPYANPPYFKKVT